jgi:hypothetical protein
VAWPPEAAVEQTARCPYCGGTAEPEQDGPVTYFECASCGGTSGYRTAGAEGLCAAGLRIVPDAAPPPAAPVFLGTTIARRPE